MSAPAQDPAVEEVTQKVEELFFEYVFLTKLTSAKPKPFKILTF
jgi:hypothetical protein